MYWVPTGILHCGDESFFFVVFDNSRTWRTLLSTFHRGSSDAYSTSLCFLRPSCSYFDSIIPFPYQYHSGQLLSIGCHLFSYVFISRFSFFISVVSPSCVITRIYFSPILIKHLVPCRILFDWVSTALSKMFWTLAWWFRAFGQYHPIGSKLKIWKWEKNQNQKWKRA